MAARIGTITGIALVPGVSRNGRLYTAEAIGRAVKRAQERIDGDGDPLTMLTHHAADDDSLQIVGRLTSLVQLEDGRAAYSADLADTDAARDIAKLVDTRKGPAFLRGVSIRGAWIGDVRKETGPDGSLVQTGTDLELDGLDFTRKPGVVGAQVVSFTPAADMPAESASGGRVLITESVQEALVTAINEDTSASPELNVESALEASVTTTQAPAGPFADHGYRGEARFPVGTRAQAKAAWVALNESTTARQYTSQQLKRVKQRVTKALKGHGVTVEATEGWLIDPAVQVTETLTVAECLGYSDDPGHGGSMCVTLTNGPTTVTVSSYCVDPHDLDAVGRAAMAGACGAIAVLDPDMDADIDVPGADAEDTDSDMGAAETAPAAATTETATAVLAPLTPAPESPAAVTASTEEEPAMAEPVTAAETAAAPATAGVTLSDEQFAQLLNRLAPTPAAVEAAPAEAAATLEAAPVVAEVAETEDQRIARLVESAVQARVTEAVQEHVEKNGPPTRKGLVAAVSETTTTPVSGIPESWPQKPLHEYTPEEWSQYVAPATVGAVLGARGNAQPE